MKKRPKNFGKMTLEQQEAVLIQEYKDATQVAENIFRELARVRGGYKIQGSDELADRPDLVSMKEE
jgi:hypothetical protein